MIFYEVGKGTEFSPLQKLLLGILGNNIFRFRRLIEGLSPNFAQTVVSLTGV
jgi:hypothetical protein